MLVTLHLCLYFIISNECLRCAIKMCFWINNSLLVFLLWPPRDVTSLLCASQSAPWMYCVAAHAQSGGRKLLLLLLCAVCWRSRAAVSPDHPLLQWLEPTPTSPASCPSSTGGLQQNYMLSKWPTRKRDPLPVPVRAANNWEANSERCREAGTCEYFVCQVSELDRLLSRARS